MVVVFDLDDTLYDEIDFVKSGFLEVSDYLKNPEYYEFMMNIFEKEGSGKVFNKLIDAFSLDVNIQKLIEVYRFHKPKIELSKESHDLLEFSKRFQLSLISDGHYITQSNKFDSLDLKKYIENPIFTDFYNTSKPNEKAFKIVEDIFTEEHEFVYVSDNPKKDFIAPHSLGWKSIRYKNSNGIYKKYKNNALYEVNSRLEIIEVLRSLENE